MIMRNRLRPTRANPIQACSTAACLVVAMFSPVWIAAEQADGFFHWMLPAQEIAKQMSPPASTAPALARGDNSFEPDYETAVWEFLSTRGLDMEDPRRELVLSRTDVNDGGHRHLRFFHEINGVRLGDTELLVHVSATGQVIGFNGYAEPTMNQLRHRAKSHLDHAGMRIGQDQIQTVIDKDAAGDSVVLHDIQARSDTRHDVVYWYVEAKVSGFPQVNVYHIADHPDASILYQTILVRSFLPVHE